MQEALAHCDTCLEDIGRNCHDVETTVISKNRFKTKSTVGLMLTGANIDVIVIGGPAHGKHISKGDKIKSVNAVAATSDNVLTLLVGDDKPGTSVDITLGSPNGNTRTVNLIRAATQHIADRCALYELFTKVKNTTSGDKSAKAVSQLVDSIIELWSKMVLADEKHDQSVIANITTLQTEEQERLLQLQESLRELERSLAETPKTDPHALRILKMELQVIQ